MSTVSLLTLALALASAFADPIDLGSCARFSLKAATRIEFEGDTTTVRTGDIGISPEGGLTGSYKINDGEIFIRTQEAKNCDTDFNTAYNQAVAMTCNAANYVAELAGKTLYPGVYCSGSSMKISATTVTLDGNGDANAQWVFQVPTALTTASTTSFILQNGAKAENVFWALGTSATLGSGSSFVGTILAQTQVSFGSSSVINGRALAFTAIVFEGGNAVSLPTLSSAPTKRTAAKMSAKMSATNAAEFDIGACAEFAVNAGTSVNFDGDVTTITGLVGVSPSEKIQGNFEFTDSKYTIQKNTQSAKDCSSTTRALYNKAQNLPCQANHTIQGGDLAGTLLTPGVYCSSNGKFEFSAATIRLDARGDPNAKFIFQTVTTLTSATATSFELLNGAKASNVFWAIGTSASLGYSSDFVGTILAAEAINVDTSAVVNGRALALTAVTFSDKGVISLPK